MNKYIKFLTVSQGTHISNDHTGMALLNQIAISDQLGNPLNVTTAMHAFPFIGSPATMHRKLNDLIHYNYVETKYEGRNRRTKFLVLTAAGRDYFDEMEKHMLEVL